MIKSYVTGNLVTILKKSVAEGRQSTFAHGCNCHDAMHSGIAWELQRAFSKIREVDSTYHELMVKANNQPNMLGGMSIAMIERCVVLNMYTQWYPGKDCRYDAIRQCFRNLNSTGFKNVMIPRIGAGVAGGDWKMIEQIINEETPDVNITVIDWDGTISDDEA